MNARILNVQRFCTKDGPGIRTTVFLKGCPLSCLWCHNPESQACGRELMYDSEQCRHCARCVSVCPQACHQMKEGKHRFDRTSCVACGACLWQGCEALAMAGEDRTVEEILAEVQKDKLFYQNSGGGMTLSGGEPLIQPTVCAALLEGAKALGIHTAVETSGAVPRTTLEETAPLTDLYLFDYKETDPARHREFIGVDNRLILENLTYLDSIGKPIVLRCPIIPTYNDREDHYEGIAALANRLQNVREIVVEPYHTLGVGKYARLGRPYLPNGIDSLDHERAEQIVNTIREKTHVTVIKA